jgi:sigma-B regulation protein RsbU (phosphoserine phosphatase)
MTGQNVLVVDDSAAQRRVLAAMLGAWGYTVSEAETGAQALQLCQSEMPDLVLSDWMMPGMDGIAFCKAFRGLDAPGYGYFILLTSRNGSQDIAAGLDAGADDFLSKPVEASELRARLNAGQRILAMQRALEQNNATIAAQLAELRGLYGAVDRDLQEAKRLQQSLVPERFLRVGRGMLAFLLRPSGPLGGDLVGHYRAGPDHLGIFALDVSGHGISAALMAARLAGYLSGTAPQQNVALVPTADGFALRGVMETLHALNDLVLREVETDHYFTLMLAHIDMQTGRAEIGQAGHPHAIVLRRDGHIEQGGAGGMPVGLLETAVFSTQQVTLSPGDRLVLLSDGVTECANPAGAMLCDAGVASLIAGLPPVPLEQFFAEFEAGLETYAGAADFTDDVSGVVFQLEDDTRDR